MKISSKRLEEVISEEIKLFTQEKKLEEDYFPEPYDAEGEKGEEYEAKVAAAKTAYQKRHWLTPGAISSAVFDYKQGARENPNKRAAAATAKRKAARLNVSEGDTNEGLEQRKAEFAKQARKQAATMGEACGDVGPPHGAIKIKIKKRNK